MVAADTDRVADLITQLGYPATAQQIARRFERIDGQSNQILLVADEQGQAVALVHVAAYPYLENDASAEILGLVVADGSRSQGIGKALVTAAEAWASSLGCGMLRVRSRIHRERAHAFYERNGFQRIKTQHCFQKDIRSDLLIAEF
jgi:GNAT superfamily N-acetyltransferase